MNTETNLPCIWPPLSNSVRWRSGPPPAVGWWPASKHRSTLCLRYWDGEYWSGPASIGNTFNSVASEWKTLLASKVKPDGPSGKIFWTDRWWPENYSSEHMEKQS